YVLPKASQLPPFELDHVETPAPDDPLGAKGVGEAGTIAAPPTIVNAVLDALAPLRVTALDMPLRPEKIWALMYRGGSAAVKASPDGAALASPEPVSASAPPATRRWWPWGL